MWQWKQDITPIMIGLIVGVALIWAIRALCRWAQSPRYGKLFLLVSCPLLSMGLVLAAVLVDEIWLRLFLITLAVFFLYGMLGVVFEWPGFRPRIDSGDECTFSYEGQAAGFFCFGVVPDEPAFYQIEAFRSVGHLKLMQDLHNNRQPRIIFDDGQQTFSALVIAAPSPRILELDDIHPEDNINISASATPPPASNRQTPRC